MTGQPVFTDLRAAMADWLGDICAFIDSRAPSGYRTVLTKVTDSGYETIDVPAGIDFAALDEIARAVDVPSIGRVVMAALQHRHLFPRLPEADGSTGTQRAWVVASVAAPILRAYVERTGDARFDRAKFDAVFDVMEQQLRSLTTPYTAIAAIDRLDLPDGAVEILPGVHLRSRTDDDLEDWINSTSGVPQRILGFTSVRAVFERPYHEAMGELTGAAESQEVLARLLTAVQLHANCDALEVFLRFRRDATFHTGMGGTVTRAPNFGPHRGMVRATDAGSIARLYEALEHSPNRDSCTLALERWQSVVSGSRPQNVVVDSWVGLESLLFRGESSSTEISYRAALRLATVVGANSNERREIFAAARKSYAGRSKIVHGVDPSKLDLEALATLTRDYLRRTLIAILELSAAFDPNRIEDELLA